MSATRKTNLNINVAGSGAKPSNPTVSTLGSTLNKPGQSSTAGGASRTASSGAADRARYAASKTGASANRQTITTGNNAGRSSQQQQYDQYGQNNNNMLSINSNSAAGGNYRSGAQPPGSPRTQNIGAVRDQILRAIDSINKHVPDLNEFFLEFDPYEGRVFEMWELLDMFNF